MTKHLSIADTPTRGVGSGSHTEPTQPFPWKGAFQTPGAPGTGGGEVVWCYSKTQFPPLPVVPNPTEGGVSFLKKNTVRKTFDAIQKQVKVSENLKH